MLDSKAPGLFLAVLLISVKCGILGSRVCIRNLFFLKQVSGPAPKEPPHSSKGHRGKKDKNPCLKRGEKADSSIKGPKGAQGQTEFLGPLKARRWQGMSGWLQLPNVTVPPL
jgi:hypothetical protein